MICVIILTVGMSFVGGAIGLLLVFHLCVIPTGRPDVSQLFPLPSAVGSAFPRCFICCVLYGLQLCLDYSFKSSQVSDNRSQHTHKVNVYRTAQHILQAFIQIIILELTAKLINMCNFVWNEDLNV